MCTVVLLLMLKEGRIVGRKFLRPPPQRGLRVASSLLVAGIRLLRKLDRILFRMIVR